MQFSYNLSLFLSLSLSLSLFLFFTLSMSLSFSLCLSLWYGPLRPYPTNQYFQCLLCPDSIDIFYTFSAWCDKTFVAVDAYRFMSIGRIESLGSAVSSFSSSPSHSFYLSLFLSFSLTLSVSPPPLSLSLFLIVIHSFWERFEDCLKSGNATFA